MTAYISPKPNDANSPNFNSSPHSPILSPSFFFPFCSCSLTSHFHFPFRIPCPQIQQQTPPAELGAESRPQTHFDASTGLKTHLVTASYSFPQHSYDAKYVIPRYVLRRQWAAAVSDRLLLTVTQTDNSISSLSLSVCVLSVPIIY